MQASLANMTQLGRDVLSASVELIREAVLAYAARRNWFVLPHRTYVEWASEIVRGEKCTWLVLDPLFPVAGLGDHVRRIRLTRQFDSNQTIVFRRYVSTETASLMDLPRGSGDVGVVDDTAGSGRTLMRVAQMVTQKGGGVTKVLLSASSGSARNLFRASFRSATWTEFVRGDWKVIHLRDGCPHLPHSGRPTDQPLVLGVDGTTVEIRVPASAVTGNPWQVLYMDAKVRGAVTTARSQMARQLSGALGRPACVRDLCLLGPFVPALVKQGETVTGDVTLEHLLRSAYTR
jgi:hypothetical protein